MDVRPSRNLTLASPASQVSCRLATSPRLTLVVEVCPPTPFGEIVAFSVAFLPQNSSIDNTDKIDRLDAA
jgi:hypothetical protein